MRRDGVVAAVLGIVLFAAAGAAFVAVADAGGDPFTGAGSVAVGGRALFGAAGWCWVVAILGLLDRRRRPSHTQAGTAGADPRVPGASRGRRLYAYLGEAVLPLYILHRRTTCWCGARQSPGFSSACGRADPRTGVPPGT